MSELHPIDNEHEAFLRERFDVPEGDPIPKKVHVFYNRVKRIADRATIFLDHRDLMWICMMCGEELPGDRPLTFLDDIKRHKLEFGAPVIVQWKKKQVLGKYAGVKGKTIVCILDDGTAEEREFEPTEVRVNLEALLAPA